MAPNAQVVPSKNALRALRKLAFGGSTVLGAVGSISGLACVSYDIRQRIHLAESIVETKRVLQSQSISNTNRKAHMAAMFEMYENGQGKEGSESWQDFNRRARRRSPQVKDATNSDFDDTIVKQDTTFRTTTKMSKRTTSPSTGSHNLIGESLLSPTPPAFRQPAQVDPNEKAPMRPDGNSTSAQRIMAATQRPLKIACHTVYGRPQESYKISAVNKIISATQQQHKLDSHAVFGRPRKSRDDALPQLANCVQQWLVPSSSILQGSGHTLPLKRPNVQRKSIRSHISPRHYSNFAEKAPNEVENPGIWLSAADNDRFMDISFAESSSGMSVSGKGAISDIEPLKPSSETIVDLAPGNLVSQDVSEPKSEDLAGESLVVTKINTLMQKYLYEADKSAGEVNHNDMEQPVYDISTLATAMTISYPARPAEVKISKTAPKITSIKPRYAMTLRTSNELDTRGAIWKNLATTIVDVKHRQGKVIAQELLTEAMFIFTESGTPEDMRDIDHLHMRFDASLQLSKRSRPHHQLIHFLLNTGHGSDLRRARELLFPRNFDYSDTDDRARTVIMHRYERDAKAYIEWLCRTDEGSPAVVLEFRKVLEMTYRLGVPPSEALFYHVLQRFRRHGELKYLRSMFDEMVATHGVEPHGLTRTILLLGYAKANDWDQVVTEFEMMHRDGFSRKEPMAYAVLFDEVLREYAASEPAERVQDFLVNAINYWGLVPISRVSATVVQAYIRARRYDLIKEWIEASRYKFPHVSTNGNRFALTVAKTWDQIGASCEEIENTCISIAQGPEKIVPRCIWGVAQEALAAHLARKLHGIASDAEASNGELSETAGCDDLSAQLNSAFTVILEHAAQNGSITQNNVATLLTQTNAALRLRGLFGAKSVRLLHVDVSPHLDRPVPRETSLSKDETRAVLVSVPEALRREPLPDCESVISLVSIYYLQRLRQDEPISHDILKMTCRQLNQAHRRADVLRLVETIYEGPAVQGVNGVLFDLEIFQTWLEAAYHLKSPSACRHVLETVLEKGSTIRLTTQFMLLARMATHKASDNRFTKHNHVGKALFRELECLLGLLTDRFYTQRKSSERKQGRRRAGMLMEHNADSDKLFARQWESAYRASECTPQSHRRQNESIIV